MILASKKKILSLSISFTCLAWQQHITQTTFIYNQKIKMTRNSVLLTVQNTSEAYNTNNIHIYTFFCFNQYQFIHFSQFTCFQKKCLRTNAPEANISSYACICNSSISNGIFNDSFLGQTRTMLNWFNSVHINKHCKLIIS